MTKKHKDKIVRICSKDRENLSKIYLENSDRNFIPALMKEDLDHMKIDNNIINESVFKLDMFTEFYNYLKEKFASHDSEKMTLREISELFPANSDIFKTFRRGTFPFLYAFSCNFTEEEIIKCFRSISSEKITDEEIKNKINEIEAKLTPSVDGFFTKFENHSLFGIIFLKKYFKKETLRHEFIHFFDFVKNKFKNVQMVDVNYYSTEINLLKKYVNEKITEKTIEYISSEDEYETLLNDFLDMLNDLRKQFFNEMNGHQFAIMICDEILMHRPIDEIDDPEQYLKDVSKLKYFDLLKNKNQFAMILFFNMIDHKVPNIRNHIFGKFNKINNDAKMTNEYKRPYTYKEIMKKYSKAAADRLAADEVHKFRMDTGIELIHREPTLQEQERIWKNWNLMTDEQKKISDEESIKLFDMTNKEHNFEIMARYRRNRFDECVEKFLNDIKKD